jgi:hypothetical protein
VSRQPLPELIDFPAITVRTEVKYEYFKSYVELSLNLDRNISSFWYGEVAIIITFKTFKRFNFLD